MIKVKTQDGRDAVVYAYYSFMEYHAIHGFIQWNDAVAVITWDKKGRWSRILIDKSHDLMLEGVDLSSVTIGAHGELPERTDAVLSHAETEMGKLHEEIKALKAERLELLRKLATHSNELKKWQEGSAQFYHSRLERIATAAMQGLLSNSGIIDIHYEREINWIKEHAMSQALALIEALDKEKAE
jgi:hypothetical protein